MRVSADKFKNITVQLEPDTLARVDEKVRKLDLNRSQYFRRLIKADLLPAENATHKVEQEVAA